MKPDHGTGHTTASTSIDKALEVAPKLGADVLARIEAIVGTAVG